MTEDSFNIYRFKKRLQSVVGNNAADYRAVEAVGDACKQMHDEGVEPYDAGIVLLLAAMRVVFSGESYEEYGHFGKFVEQTGQRAVRLADDFAGELDHDET